MAAPPTSETIEEGGTFAPLAEPLFRRVWIASLFSNFGHLILGVAAAWEMTRLTSSATMVALVQTALMLPYVLVSVPAGAIADMFDRRKVALAGLAFSIVCAIVLTLLSRAGLAGPWVLLAFCSLIGTGVALYSPAWQASIPEQVGAPQLPAAIALGTISYNVARSVGPALGGLLVLAAGAQAAFALNALLYVPLFLAFMLWQRVHAPSRLPPQRLDHAIRAGGRYVRHSGAVRTVLTHAVVFGFAGATASALAPLIARDMLGGDAAIYGIMLGAGGAGAVLGATMTVWLRQKFGTERLLMLNAVASGLALILVAWSHSLVLTCFGMMVLGVANIASIATFNVLVQLAAPRWVAARALSLFSASLTGGIALGAWVWGQFAAAQTLQLAIMASGVLMLAMPILNWLLPLPKNSDVGVESAEIGNEVEVELALTLRSGPIVIEIDYRVDPGQARAFYADMLAVQRVRLRNGGFEWSLARDIADPTAWTERYHCPTWGDYLRMRDRYIQADIDIQAAADAHCLPGTERKVTRRLERPLGSVRWMGDSHDPKQETIGYVGP